MRVWPYLLSVFLFIVYCAWIAAPYLRSIVARDAAITSWSNLATAPLSGSVTFAPVAIGSRIGEGGLIAMIRNDHVSREAVAAATLRVALGNAQREHAQAFLYEIESLEDDRRTTKADYAALFRDQLDTRIRFLSGRIDLYEGRLAAMEQIADRSARLAASGAGSNSAADEQALRLSEMHIELEALKEDREILIQSRSASEKGIFIQVTGGDLDWVLKDRMELKIEKKKARLEMRTAEILLAVAKTELAHAEAEHERRSAGNVRAPASGLLWRKHAATGMTVTEGEPVAEWLDCDVLLVDMPVSDAEASLIPNGHPAKVVLEGEKEARPAEVLLVRGSASTLGKNELAALAKGRRPDLAQVLLKLNASQKDFQTCPVGQAAYVEFPGIGLIDIVRARLRL